MPAPPHLVDVNTGMVLIPFKMPMLPFQPPTTATGDMHTFKKISLFKTCRGQRA